MKLQKLNNVATPGPVCLCHDSTGYHVGTLDTPCGYPLLDGSSEQDERNAAKLAHCYNHFDELFEALKREAARDSIGIPAIEELIAKAVEVQGI